MKRSLSMSLLVARSPPTFTWAPLPNRMPLELISQTWPLAVRLPSMCEGLTSRMRFSAIDDPDGWRNCTDSLAAMLKLLQSMTARPVPCVTVRLGPAAAIAACPAVTYPPVGLARETGIALIAANPANAEVARRRRVRTDERMHQ